MEAPSFDYSKMPSNQPVDATDSPSAPVIESASASTENQANDSRFAYILTACVLGVVALFAVAFIWLGIGIVQTAVSTPHAYGHGDEAYEDGSWDRYADELDEFEDRLWDEYYSELQMDA